ncbi:MAG: hydroxysqualene dehydroxylase HpnE [Acidimicrobiales bacterium]|jgi:squalene-associated FAD-dependent desaturase
MSPARIGVVGGGLGGLAAALSARDAGAEVVLFERRPSLGGLTSSIRRNGLSFDNGQHVFLRCCSAYRGFLERIGANDKVFLQDRLNVPVLAPDRERASIRSSALPAPLHLAGSLARYHHLSLRERLRLGRPALALGRLDPDDPALDEVCFGDWLARQGQSERAIERLWNLIALPTLNVSAGEASLGLATKVFRVGLLDSSDAGDIGWSSVPLSQLHGALPARALEMAGAETVLGAPVTAIARTPAGSFRIVSSERSDVVDAVIVATPLRISAALGAFKREADLEALGLSPIVNVHLVLDRKVTDLAFAACVGSPVQFVFDRTASSGVASGQYLAISLSAADEYIARGSSELVSTFLEALRELLPAARDARVVDALVTRERAATFRAVPGTRALRPATATAVPGMFLAGAWCDTGWPATMEGAVRAGQQAASEALAHVSGSGAEAQRELEGAGT